MSENWNPITGYEGRYEISDLGRVRSVDHFVPHSRNPEFLRLAKGRVLRTHSWGAKYPGIVLLDKNGQRDRRMVHRLVAEAFVQNPLGYEQINHIDGDKWNARATNLEWCNQSMNVAHAHAIGLRPTGKHHHFSLLKRDALGRCMGREA